MPNRYPEGFYQRYGPMVLGTLSGAAAAMTRRRRTRCMTCFVGLLRHRDRLRDEARRTLLLRVATNVCLEPYAHGAAPARGRRRREAPADRGNLGCRERWTDAGARSAGQALPHGRPAGCEHADHRGHAPGRRHDPGRDGARGGAVGLEAFANACAPRAPVSRSWKEPYQHEPLPHDEASKKIPMWLLERAEQGELARCRPGRRAANASGGRRAVAGDRARSAGDLEPGDPLPGRQGPGGGGDPPAGLARRRDAVAATKPQPLPRTVGARGLAGDRPLGVAVGPWSVAVASGRADRRDSAGREPVGRVRRLQGDRAVDVAGSGSTGSGRWPIRIRPDGSSRPRALPAATCCSSPTPPARDGRYGVLLSIDGAGRVTQHLPEPGASAASTLHAPSEIRLPSAYELDDAPGFERFLLITSTQPFPVAAALDAARSLAGQGQSARTAPLPLPPAFHQTSVLLGRPAKERHDLS